MNRFEFFDLLPPMPQPGRQRIQWAYFLSKMVHRGQTRDLTGDPYFVHPRDVTLTLVRFGYTSWEQLCASLLHDVPEDTLMMLSLLERVFGPKVARAVLTLSRSYCLEDPLTGFLVRTTEKPKELYYESLRRGGAIVCLVKGADRICNLRDLVDPPPDSRWTPEKRLRKVEETRTWVIPLVQEHDPRMAAELASLADRTEANVKLLQQRAQAVSVPAGPEVSPGGVTFPNPLAFVIPPVRDALLAEALAAVKPCLPDSVGTDEDILAAARTQLQRQFEAQDGGPCSREPSEGVVLARAACAASVLPEDRQNLAIERTVEEYYRRLKAAPVPA